MNSKQDQHDDDESWLTGLCVHYCVSPLDLGVQMQHIVHVNTSHTSSSRLLSRPNYKIAIVHHCLGQDNSCSVAAAAIRDYFLGLKLSVLFIISRSLSSVIWLR